MSKIIVLVSLFLGVLFSQGLDKFSPLGDFSWGNDDSLVFETPECCSQEDSLLEELKASRIEVSKLLKSKAGDKSADTWGKITSVVVLPQLATAPLIKRLSPELPYTAKEKKKMKAAVVVMPLTPEEIEIFVNLIEYAEPYLIKIKKGDFFRYMGFRNNQWIANVYLNLPEEEEFYAWAYPVIETSFGRKEQLVFPWACTNPSIWDIPDTVLAPCETCKMDTTINVVDTIVMFEFLEQEQDTIIPDKKELLVSKSDFYLYGGRWFPKERDDWYSIIDQPFGTEFFGGGASYFATRKDFRGSHFGPTVAFNSYHSYGLAFMEDDRGSVYDTSGFHSYGVRAGLGGAGIFPLSTSVIVTRLLLGAQWDWSYGGGYKSRQFTPMASVALTYDKWFDNSDLSYWATANLSFWGRKLSEWQGEALTRQDDPANSRDDIGHGLRWFGWKKVTKDKRLSDGALVQVTQPRKVNYGFSVRNLYWGETGSDINGKNIAKAVTAGPGVRIADWNLNLFVEYKYVWGSHWENNNGHSLGFIAEIWGIQKYAPR